MNKLNEYEHQELMALYQATTQDLASFKDQQITITNYALVALAAVVGVTQLTGIAWQCKSRIILFGAAFVVVGAALWIIWRLRCSIEARRVRLDRVYERLSSSFRIARGGSLGRVSSKTIAVVLSVLLVGGLILTGYALYATKPHF